MNAYLIGPQWVCRACIGEEEFEEYTIGALGEGTCVVCGGKFRQPPLAFVSNMLYRKAADRAASLADTRQTNKESQ